MIARCPFSRRSTTFSSARRSARPRSRSASTFTSRGRPTRSSTQARSLHPDARHLRSEQRQDRSGQHDRGAQGGSRADLDPHDRLRLARARRSDRRGAPGRGRRGAAAVGVRRAARRHPPLRSEAALTSIADIVDAARRLQGLVLRTPLRRSDWLSTTTGAEVYLKLEIVQPTSSYKIRGAFNAALKLRRRAAGRSADGW